MTTQAPPATTLSLRAAFEAEQARRAAERHAREEAERRQQEADLASAAALHEAIAGDPGFLADRGLSSELRRYTVTVDHAAYRVAVYFEGGRASVTLSDKRAAGPGSGAPRRQETVETVEDALKVMAQFLADETR